MALTKISTAMWNSVPHHDTHDFNVDDVLFVDVSDNKVGIGTTSPGSKFQVKTGTNNNIAFNVISGGTLNGIQRITSYNDAITLSVPLAINGLDLYFTTGSANTERIKISSGGDISFRDTSANEAFYWDASAASLGIGTTSPTNAKLQINTSSAGEDPIRAYNSSGVNTFELGHLSGDDPYFAMTTNSGVGEVLFRLDNGDSYINTGDLGIGTTSPNSKLEVVGQMMITNGYTGGKQADHYLYIGGDGIASANAAIYIGNKGDGSGYGWELFYEGTGSGNNNKFKLIAENLGSPVEVLTALQDGNVGIGTASPTQKLEVSGTAKASSVSVNSSTSLIADNTILFGGAYSASLYTNGDGFNIGVGSTPPAGGQLSSNFTIDSSGSVIATVDMRAPIFYDSDDTSYYVNPAGTSIQNFIKIYSTVPQLAIEDSNNGAGGGAQGIITFRNTQGKAIGIGYTANETSNSDLIISTNAASTYGGYLGLDAGAILDTQADIILDPKTDVRIYGNVGIGTDSPTRELHLEKSTDNAIMSIVSSPSYISGLVLGDTANDDEGGILYNNSSNYLYFLAGASERLRIDSSGVATFTGPVISEGPDGGMVMREWTGSSTFGMIGTANMSGSEYALLTSGTNTYIGSGTGGTTYIRGGANDDDPEMLFDSSQVLVRSNGADTLFGIQGNSSGQYDPILNFLGSGSSIATEGAQIWYDNSVGDLHISTTYANNAADIRFYTRTGTDKGTNNERLNIAGSGAVTALVDMRAPIFYDSNDTAFYLNPSDGITNPVLRFYGNRLLSRYVSSWAGNEDHDILYSGYATALGDYVYLKAAGNSSSSLGSIVITDGAGFYFGRSASRTGGVDNSATSPISTVLFRVDNSGNTYAQSLYDSGDTSYYLDPANSSKALRIAGDIEIVKANPEIEIRDTNTSSTGNYSRIRFSNSSVIPGGSVRNYSFTMGMSNTQSEFDINNALKYNISNRRLYLDAGNNSYIQHNGSYLSLYSPSGYVDIGSGNSSFSHFSTDRPEFYFNKPVAFDGNIRAYGGDETASFAAYYDSGDTSYYVNPNDTSVSVRVAGFVDAGPDTAFRLYNGSSFRGGLGDGQWATGNSSYTNDLAVYATNNLHFHTSGGNEYQMRLDTNGNLMMGRPGYGQNTYGCWVSLEGNTDASGEGSGRIFFREHNSTTAAMDNYGMSFGYRGGGTSVTTAGGNTWGGLSQIGNGQWGLWGHNNSLNGAIAMWGDRAGSYIIASGSFRAPIFYDSDNTAYYCNPASLSYFNQLRINGYIYTNDNDTIRLGSSSDFRMWHNGTHNYFRNYHHAGGNMYWQGENTSGVNHGIVYMYCDVDRPYVILLEDDTTKLTTTSTGVTISGQLDATGDVVAYSSDKRLKENIKNIENPLDKISKLNGVTFDWKNQVIDLGFNPRNKKEDVGVIAQEVEEIFPQIIAPAPFDVEHDHNTGELKSKSGKNYKTVQYEKLVPLLIEAVKELSEKVKMLENK